MQGLGVVQGEGVAGGAQQQRSECQSVEQAVLVQGLGVVQGEGVADGAQRQRSP